MSCKIAEHSSSIQALTWPSAGPSVSSVSRPRPSAGTQNHHDQSGEQLAELERSRQAELAKCRETAFEEGLQKGREQLALEMESVNDRLGHTLKDLLVAKRRMRNEAECDVVKLSLAVARRILHRELQTDPDSIQGVVYAGLQKLQNREISQIRVAPQAMQSVRTALDKAGLLPAVSLSPDPRMRVGDVIFETAFGELDASIETQLHEIERGFVDRLGISC